MKVRVWEPRESNAQPSYLGCTSEWGLNCICKNIPNSFFFNGAHTYCEIGMQHESKLYILQ